MNDQIKEAVDKTEQERIDREAVTNVKVMRIRAGLTDDVINGMKKCAFCGSVVNLVNHAVADKTTGTIKELTIGLQCMNGECFFFLPPVIPLALGLELIRKFNIRKISDTIIMPGGH